MTGDKKRLVVAANIVTKDGKFSFVVDRIIEGVCTRVQEPVCWFDSEEEVREFVSTFMRRCANRFRTEGFSIHGECYGDNPNVNTTLQ